MRKKYTIKDMQDFAAKRNGLCLSDEYVKAKIKLQWQCSSKHTWSATPDSVVRGGSWCPYCAWEGKNRKYTIEYMKKLAAKKGGNCLSTEFINVDKKLKWKCADGHIWETAPNSMIHRGTWCPNCRYLGERKCRYVFETLFGEKFPTTAVKPKDGKLILDGYAETLNMAFEYQGQQHYRYMPHLHKTEENFEKSCKRDVRKVEWCKVNDIRLTVIPYWENEDDENLLEFICKETGASGQIDWNDFYSNLSVLRKWREFAKSKQGKLISNYYGGTAKKLEWECSQGHRWKAIPDSIRSGSWCPYCARNVRLTLLDIQQLAIKRGGECLSTYYVNLHTKMEFECSEGHRWFRKPCDIKYKQRWCSVCSEILASNTEAKGV